MKMSPPRNILFYFDSTHSLLLLVNKVPVLVNKEIPIPEFLHRFVQIAWNRVESGGWQVVFK